MKNLAKKEEPNQVGEKADFETLFKISIIIWENAQVLDNGQTDEIAAHIYNDVVTPLHSRIKELERINAERGAVIDQHCELIRVLESRERELESKLTPIEPLKEETKLQSEQKTAEDGFKEKLAIEILARFTGSSRGTPIAKQGFIDGALWAASQFKSQLPINQNMLNLIKEADAWLSFNTSPSVEQIMQFRKSLQEVIAAESQPLPLQSKTVEEGQFTIEDMVAFAAYLHDHSWEYDYREEKPTAF